MATTLICCTRRRTCTKSHREIILLWVWWTKQRKAQKHQVLQYRLLLRADQSKHIIDHCGFEYYPWLRYVQFVRILNTLAVIPMLVALRAAPMNRWRLILLSGNMKDETANQYTRNNHSYHCRGHWGLRPSAFLQCLIQDLQEKAEQERQDWKRRIDLTVDVNWKRRISWCRQLLLYCRIGWDFFNGSCPCISITEYSRLNIFNFPDAWATPFQEDWSGREKRRWSRQSLIPQDFRLLELSCNISSCNCACYYEE